MKIDMERITKIIYEATRLEAMWSNRSIIPEEWSKRDEAFKKQMIEVVGRHLARKKLPTPKEAHNSWMESYFKMGWKYGERRDPILKTHPDLVSYDELPKDERDKDAIFLAFIWLAKELSHYDKRK